MKTLFPILSFLLIACNPTTVPEQGRWNGNGERPEIEAEGLQPAATVNSKDERLEYSEQKIGMYSVENAYRKTVFREGSAVFESYSLVKDQKMKGIERRAKALDMQKEMIWALFLKQSPYYSQLKLEKSIQVSVLNLQNKLQPAICAELQEKNGELQEICISGKIRILRERKLGSGLDGEQAKILIFPKGPKNSDLSPAMVPRILINEGVKSNWVEVNTEGPEKILKNSALEIQPKDERFDQTQAFYFANQMFAWLAKNQILETALPLKITTHMGYPDRTNTAFYFGGRIRLGTGDDIVYSRIPWDPSIVMHEVAHAAVERIAHLPFEGEGGSINEGYADLFASFLLNNPHMAENSYKTAPFRRSADSVVKMSERTGGLYHDAALVSGFFWALKSFLPEDKILLYAVRVLNRLGPDTNFENFKLALKEQKEELFTNGDLQKVNQLMKERELE